MAEPVIVRINRRRSALIGTGCAALGVVSLGFMALCLAAGRPDGTLIALSLLCAGAFLWLGVHFIGIAWRNPVALRLDAKGISGYYTPPAEWSEIKTVRRIIQTIDHNSAQGILLRQRVEVQQMGFEFHDPIAMRDRQTAWQRLASWSNGRANGVHVVVPEAVLKGVTVAELLPKAQALHAVGQPNTTS